MQDQQSHDVRLQETLPGLFALGEKPRDEALAVWLPDAWQSRDNALFSSTTIDGSQFNANQAIGGAGGDGANCGNSQGGAIENGDTVPSFFGSDKSTLTLQNSRLHGNRAEGGAGGVGGNGGDGLGGGLFSDAGSTATILGDVICGNIALGAAGSGGSAGLGEGGG
jgi:hypothetical protein